MAKKHFAESELIINGDGSVFICTLNQNTLPIR